MNFQSSQLNSHECTSKGSLTMKAQYMLGPDHAAAWGQPPMGNHSCSKANLYTNVVVGQHYITACIAKQGRT